MTVEMGFLGLTFAAACAGQPRRKAIIAVLTGPIILMIGSGVGGLVAVRLPFASFDFSCSFSNSRAMLFDAMGCCATRLVLLCC